MILTTSAKSGYKTAIFSKRLSEHLNLKYYPRKAPNVTLASKLIVNSNLELRLMRNDKKDFFFHPSISKIRIKNAEQGNDYLIKALDLKDGDTVFDCTFGLGSEAILVSYYNPNGRTIGSEKSREIFTVVYNGLRTYEDKSEKLTKALRRIELRFGDYKEIVKQYPDIDKIYIDPMFKKPIFKSSSINAFREFASKDYINEDDLRFLKSRAKNRVVVKIRLKDKILPLELFNEIISPSKSDIVYGIIYADSN
jgi:16S rRNA (guanine1516-N2)-methyltransferase